LASFISKYLQERDAKISLYEPIEGVVNVVSSLGQGKPHIVLNGHLDQFPGEVGEKWTHPPYSGLVSNDRIYGRGSGDMKGGLASLLFCYTLLAKEDLPGRITFTGTSDEETGGQWGAKWLLENVEWLTGDAVLNGEPSGLTVRIGEKSRVPLLLWSHGKAAHGSFAGYVGENAIMKMARVLPLVEKLQGLTSQLSKKEESLTSMVMKGYEEQYGHESSTMANVLRQVTVNIGTISGGVKDNIVPAECHAEVDIRIPLGISPVEIKKKLEETVHEVEPSIVVDWNRDPSIVTESTYTGPEDKIVKTLANNSKLVTGLNPLLSFTSGGTDCRFWRKIGVPAVSYGPKVYSMGGVDEHITVNDLVSTVKVHVGTILDYLSEE
jgi:succinyl-diaminopimelate desuccinylase